MLGCHGNIMEKDLSFEKGDLIRVKSKKGDWWRGELGDSLGVFPSTYVQPVGQPSLLPLESSIEAKGVPSPVFSSTVIQIYPFSVE